MSQKETSTNLKRVRWLFLSQGIVPAVAASTGRAAKRNNGGKVK